MDFLKVIAGWTLIILALAAPFIAAIIIVAVFFAGVQRLLAGLSKGNAASIAFGLTLMSIGLMLGYIGVRWATEWKVGPGQFEFVEKMTPEMLARPRVFLAGRAIGSHDVVNHLMLNGAIDFLVGELRNLPLVIPDFPRTAPATLDRKWRLKLIDHECASANVGARHPMDACFNKTEEPINEKIRGFSVGNSSSAEPYNFKLYYRDGRQMRILATCEILVSSPIFRSMPFFFGPYSSDFDKAAAVEARRCKIELLQQLAQRLTQPRSL